MRRFLSIGAITSLNLVIGFSAQWYLMVALGPGIETDAYFSAQTITLTIVTVLAGGLTNVLVPIIVNLRGEDREGVVLGLLISAAVGFVVLSWLMSASAVRWVPLLLPGLVGPGLEAALSAGTIQGAAAGLLALAIGVTSVHRAYGRFVWPEVANLLAGILSFVGLLLLVPRYGVAAASWLVVGRAAMNIALQLRGLPYRARPRFPLVVYRQIWTKYRPLLLGASVYKTGPIIDRYLASHGPAGTITLLGFALQIYQMFLSVVDRGLAAPLVAQTASRVRDGREPEIRRDYIRVAVPAAGLGLLVWLAVWLSGEAGLGLIIGHGSVTGENVGVLFGLMLVLGAMLPMGVVGTLAASCLYGVGETGKVTRIAVVNFLVAVALKFLLFWHFGLYGLAAGIVAYQVLNAASLHWVVIRMGKR